MTVAYARTVLAPRYEPEFTELPWPSSADSHAPKPRGPAKEAYSRDRSLVSVMLTP